MKNYKHKFVTRGEEAEIVRLKLSGEKVADIARILGRGIATINKRIEQLCAEGRLPSGAGKSARRTKIEKRDTDFLAALAKTEGRRP